MTETPALAAPATWNLPPLRPGTPVSAELAALRGHRIASPDSHPGVRIEKSSIAGVPCMFCEPAESTATILYFHGGAYWRGYPEMWGTLASRIASAARARIVLPDYALAPERPFPAAIHDAARVYTDLVSSGQRMIIAGDSAGGGLGAALVAASADAAVQAPSGLVLISPWLDLTARARSYITNRDCDVVFSPASARRGIDLYLQGGDPEHPLVSPIFCATKEFPPTLIMCGTEEILLDDSLSFTRNLAAAGVDVELHVAAGMQHVWPLLEPDSRQAAMAVQRIARHVERLCPS